MSGDPLYELWWGTPNVMGRRDTKGAFVAEQSGKASDCRRAALKILRDAEAKALKYESENAARITLVIEAFKKDPELKPGTSRGWQFPFMGVTARIEIRRVK